jgi:hypothetical protein
MVLQLGEGIGGAEMAAGSDAYQDAFVFYKSVKTAAAQDIPGAKAVYEELKTRFPGGRPRTGGSQDLRDGDRNRNYKKGGCCFLTAFWSKKLRFWTYQPGKTCF